MSGVNYIAESAEPIRIASWLLIAPYMTCAATYILVLFMQLDSSAHRTNINKLANRR